MITYFSLLENAFNQVNGFVINVAVTSFCTSFLKQNATDAQARWLAKNLSLVTKRAVEYFDLICIIREYEYDDLASLAENMAEVDEVPRDIRTAFEIVYQTEDLVRHYGKLMDRVHKKSPFDGTGLKSVISSFLLFLVAMESYKNSVINDTNQLDPERLHEDSDEFEYFEETTQNLVNSAVMLVHYCIAAQTKNTISRETIGTLLTDIRGLALKFEQGEQLGRSELIYKFTQADKQTEQTPSVFISYSHDDDAHKEWVGHFATKLRMSGITVLLDQWDLRLGQDVNYFMENIARCDFVVVVCTPQYKEKADSDKPSGVQAETQIIRPEIYANVKSTKFIPIIRRGSAETSLPIFLRGRVYVTCKKSEEVPKALDDVAKVILNVPSSVDIYRDEILSYFKL